MIDLIICSHAKADALVPKMVREGSLDGLVSIHAPAASKMSESIQEPMRHRSCLGFDDFQGAKIKLVFDDTDIVLDSQYRPNPQNIRDLIAMSIAAPEHGRFLFHCHAGISRSTAAALTFMVARLKIHDDDSLRACLDAVYTARPCAWFNDDIVALTDEALCLGNRLVQMVAAWKSARRGVLVW